MKRAMVYIAIYGVILVLSLFALRSYISITQANEDRRVFEYARIMSNYLWTMNRTSAEDFLALIVNQKPLRAVQINHADNSPFVHYLSESTHTQWSVRPAARTLKVPIVQDEQRIGFFIAQINMETSPYLVFGLIQALFVMGFYFSYRYTRRRQEYENTSQLATSVLQNAAEGIMVIDASGKIEVTNPAFTKITGYQGSEIIGSDTEFRRSDLHDDDFYKEMLASLDQNGLWEGEVWRRRKSGEIYPEWLSVTAVKDSEGRQVRRVSLFRDITEQKNAEAELIKVRNRLAEAEHLAKVGSWEWQLEDGSVWWSEGIFRIFGLDPKKVTPNLDSFQELLHPEDQDKLNWADNTSDEFAGEKSIVCRIVRADGELRHIKVIADFQRNADGKLARLIGTVHDITERALTEEILRKAKEKAEHADLAKSRFLAAASHDLRQPLQALNLLVAALEQVIASSPMGHNDRAGHLVGKINRSLESLSDLLNALLDISRLDAGTLVPEIRSFPIQEILSWVEETYAPKAQAKDLEIRVVDSSLVLESDPVLLQQVVGNLVSNAIRYTNQGKVLVGCRRRGEKIEIGVYDNGVGIPIEKQKEIFQEFLQLSNPARRREKGLGLGLAIVERMAVLLGHRVGVRSTPDKGSCFSILLNSGEEKKQNLPASSPDDLVSEEEKPLQGKVLVIDDDPAVLESMSLLLTQWGLDITSALSSGEALSKCRALEGNPQLIVADYRLQEKMNGAEAINLITRELGEEIPGVIITGDTSVDRIQEASASGYLLLHKPLQPADLRTALEGILKESVERNPLN